MGIKISLRRDLLTRLRDQSKQSGILTYLTLAVIAYYLMPPTLISELLSFFSGDIKGVIPGGNAVVIIGTMVSIVVLRIPIAILIGSIIKILLGKPVSNRSLFKYGDGQKRWLASLLFIITIEELLGRWLFIEILPNALNINSSLGLWGLLIGGNIIWTILHLYNFEKEKERKVGYVITQFVGGFFYAFVFIKFGLVPCILMHFMFNAVLFSGLKGQIVENYRYIKAFLQLCLAGVMYMIFSQDVRDLLIWFVGQGAPTSLEGWGLIDYLAITLAVSLAMQAILNLLSYDETVPKEEEKELTFFEQVLLVFFATAVLIGMVFVVEHLLSDVIPIIYLRMVMVYLIVFSIAKFSSPNHAVKAFWISLTDGWILICIMIGLDWQMAYLYLLLIMVSELALSTLLKKLIPASKHAQDAQAFVIKNQSLTKKPEFYSE